MRFSFWPRSVNREVSLNAKPSPKPFKSSSRKRLLEPIGNLLSGWNVFQVHCSKVLDLSLPLALDFHVLRAGMVLRVRSQGDGSLVVTTDNRCSFSLAHVQLIEESSQPDCFFGCLCLAKKFSFTGPEGNDTLTLRLPINCSTPEIEEISSY
ncbi:hypothetical protein M433DRAFT_535663 [Acidomyces richmondensis BFW]|nr:hypothetical protein M433DRAFT_535663 [Acidomyces richmondensis BFW]